MSLSRGPLLRCSPFLSIVVASSLDQATAVRIGDEEAESEAVLSTASSLVNRTLPAPHASNYCVDNACKAGFSPGESGCSGGFDCWHTDRKQVCCIAAGAQASPCLAQVRDGNPNGDDHKYVAAGPCGENVDLHEIAEEPADASDPYVCTEGVFYRDPEEWGEWSKAKQDWCCMNKHIGCKSDTFDCAVGLHDDPPSWSQEKIHWCCEVKRVACARDKQAGSMVSGGLFKDRGPRGQAEKEMALEHRLRELEEDVRDGRRRRNGRNDHDGRRRRGYGRDNNNPYDRDHRRDHDRDGRRRRRNEEHAQTSISVGSLLEADEASAYDYDEYRLGAQGASLLEEEAASTRAIPSKAALKDKLEDAKHELKDAILVQGRLQEKVLDAQAAELDKLEDRLSSFSATTPDPTEMDRSANAIANAAIKAAQEYQAQEAAASAKPCGYQPKVGVNGVVEAAIEAQELKANSDVANGNATDKAPSRLDEAVKQLKSKENEIKKRTQDAKEKLEKDKETKVREIMKQTRKDMSEAEFAKKVEEQTQKLDKETYAKVEVLKERARNETADLEAKQEKAFVEEAKQAREAKASDEAKKFQARLDNANYYAKKESEGKAKADEKKAKSDKVVAEKKAKEGMAVEEKKQQEEKKIDAEAHEREEKAFADEKKVGEEKAAFEKKASEERASAEKKHAEDLKASAAQATTTNMQSAPSDNPLPTVTAVAGTTTTDAKAASTTGRTSEPAASTTTTKSVAISTTPGHVAAASTTGTAAPASPTGTTAAAPASSTTVTEVAKASTTGAAPSASSTGTADPPSTTAPAAAGITTTKATAGVTTGGAN